jgi:hypothetical protein
MYAKFYSAYLGTAPKEIQILGINFSFTAFKDKETVLKNPCIRII